MFNVTMSTFTAEISETHLHRLRIQPQHKNTKVVDVKYGYRVSVFALL